MYFPYLLTPQIFVDQVNADVVAVTRHNPSSHQSVLLIAHTCFGTFKWTPDNCRPISVADNIDAILFELKTVEDEKAGEEEEDERMKSEIITGLPSFFVECYENVPLDGSDAIEIRDGAVHFKLFPSGSVVALK